MRDRPPGETLLPSYRDSWGATLAVTATRTDTRPCSNMDSFERIAPVIKASSSITTGRVTSSGRWRDLPRARWQ